MPPITNTKAPTKKAVPASAKQAPTKNAKKAPAKKAPAKKAPAKKAPAKKAPAKKAPAKKAPAKKAPAKKARRVGKKWQPADAAAIGAVLARAVPDPRCELRFASPFELLIATILAAQSTDRMVNEVMGPLLARWSDAPALAAASQEDVEGVVRRTGFFHTKAKAIRETAAALVRDHDGQVPRTMEELVALKGVARKTANVVLGTAYGLSVGFVVDTHVARVSGRLGLTRESDPVKIERDLCAQFPPTDWPADGHRLTLHGRYTCLAQRPACTRCPLNELCPSREAAPEGSREERAQLEDVHVHAALLRNGIITAT